MERIIGDETRHAQVRFAPRWVTPPEQRARYDAIGATLREMVAQGGRASEHNLYNALGGYQRVLDSTTVGQPCPACGTAIEKIQFLGGAAYFCPRCQV